MKDITISLKLIYTEIRKTHKGNTYNKTLNYNDANDEANQLKQLLITIEL